MNEKKKAQTDEQIIEKQEEQQLLARAPRVSQKREKQKNYH